MTTKRTPLRRAAKGRITPALLDIWRRLQRLQAGGAHKDRAAQVQRDEYRDLRCELDRLLDIPPWQPSPMEAVRQQPPDYMVSGSLVVGLEGWRKAWEWRQALEEACHGG